MPAPPRSRDDLALAVGSGAVLPVQLRGRLGVRHRLRQRHEVAGRGDDEQRLVDRDAVARAGPAPGPWSAERATAPAERGVDALRRRAAMPRTTAVLGAHLGLVAEAGDEPVAVHDRRGRERGAGRHRLERRAAQLLVVGHRLELRGGELPRERAGGSRAPSTVNPRTSNRRLAGSRA